MQVLTVGNISIRHNTCFILFLCLMSHDLVKLKTFRTALTGYYLAATPFMEFLDGLTSGWMRGLVELSGDITVATWDGTGRDGNWTL